MIDALKTSDIKNMFLAKRMVEDFVVDKSGALTIELIGANFIADKPSIFGKPNEAYIDAELDWYESQSTNVNDINYGSDVPAAWKATADKYGNINSNYGKLIYSTEFHNQYQNVFNELSANPDSRRATMVYTRPSIWNEYNTNGKSDFICTNAVGYLIRNDILHVTVQMRSNDIVFGYKNDYAWQAHVAERLQVELSVPIDGIKIHWQVQSLHMYQRHFDLLGLHEVQT